MNPSRPSDTEQPAREPTPGPALEIPKAELQQALNTILAASLRPLAAGLGGLYVLFTVAHLLAVPWPVGVILSVVAGLTAVVLFLLTFALGRFVVPAPWAHPVGAGITALVLGNCLQQLWLIHDPRLTINFMLLAVGTGFFALSTRWLIGALLVTLLGWAAVMWQSGPLPAREHYGFGLLSAAVLAVLIHVARVRALRRLEGLRLRDEAMKAQLQVALAKVEAARQAEAASKRELVEVNAALQRSEARTRALLDAVPDRILKLSQAGVLLDFKGERPEELFLQSGPVIGASLHEVLPRPPADQLLHGVSRALATCQMQTLEFEQTAGGVTRFFESRLVKSGEGEVIAIVRDISQRRRAEAERQIMERRLQEAQKLEHLGQMAGGIAHDFNNLLTTVLGNASLLKRGFLEDSAVYCQLTAIEKAAMQAAGLCQQMLAYAGQGEFVFRRLDLNAVITDLGDLLASSAGKNVALQFNLAPDLPPVEADESQVRQVLLNLVVNGAEAIGEQPGVIRITTGTFRADRDYLAACEVCAEPKEGQYAIFDVADNGCGLSAETKEKIFDPFFTTKFIGRGLGLAAVQGIVRTHRGAIKVTSEPGRGATFRVLLPCTETPISPAPTRPPAAADWRGRGTVLLVDDEEEVRKVAGRMLETLGFGVLGARDGQEAVETFLVLADRITVVVLDLVMPRLGGEEAFRQIRRIRPSAPIILISGYSEQETLKAFADSGPVPFLQKPFKLEELRAKLRSVLAEQEQGKS
ncbi:MAG: response regulator [Verrucomicrobia bacterium]|nr:response regulator [Verrucomicrobiota bacterium]